MVELLMILGIAAVVFVGACVVMMVAFWVRSIRRELRARRQIAAAIRRWEVGNG